MSTSFSASINKDYAHILGMITAMIDACPDALWKRKAGGFVFWQQLLHAVSTAAFFAGEGYAAPAVHQPPDVIQLKIAPSQDMSKAELKEYVTAVSQAVAAYCDALTKERLHARHETLSSYFGREITVRDSLLKLLWHTAYHLGCCDALLREEGVPGVF